MPVDAERSGREESRFETVGCVFADRDAGRPACHSAPFLVVRKSVQVALDFPGCGQISQQTRFIRSQRIHWDRHFKVYRKAPVKR